METEKKKVKMADRLLEHVVVGGLVFGCGVVAVVDAVAIKPYMFIKDLIDRQRD